MISEALIDRARIALAAAGESDSCAKVLRELLAEVDREMPAAPTDDRDMMTVGVAMRALPTLLYVGTVRGREVLLSAPALDLGSRPMPSRVELRVMLALVDHAQEILGQALGSCGRVGPVPSD